LSPAFGILAKALSPAFGILAKALSPAFGILAKALSSAFGILAKALSSAFGILAKALSPAFGILAKALSPAFGILAKALSSAFGILAKALSRGFGILAKALSRGFGILAKALSRGFAILQKAFGTKPTLLVFITVVAAYSLCAWDRMLGPSPQFHFVDLAQSFLDGRLDTDTPRERSSNAQEGDARGYREALARTEKAGGWNDWAFVRKLTLKDGEVVRGRFPWEGGEGERRHIFYGDDNRELKIVVPNDLARTCGETGRGLCDERVYYISFPPFPALAMLPVVAVFGYDTNDVLITVLVGGLNAVLLFWFLQLLVLRGHSKRTTRDNVLLTIAFALGTVTFFSSVRGEVWFTALVFGVALNIGFMLAALDLRHPIVAGLLLGCGFATRTPVLFCGAFFAWQLFFKDNRWDLALMKSRWREILVTGTKFALPLGAVLIALAWYNHARFGDSGEFGHAYLQGSAYDRVRDHGMFSFTYLNRNLLSALLSMPRFTTDSPFVMVSNHGLGLIFTTPLFLYLLWPREQTALRWALWAAVAAAAIPGLFYQNTGWIQFGFRFAMDYMPYLFGLLAIGGRPLGRTATALIVFGIIVNLFGAITFGRMGIFYYDTVMPGAT